MRRAAMLAGAAVCLALAAVLSLLALDVARRDRSFQADDVLFRVGSLRDDRWQPTEIVPFGAARALLGVDDDASVLVFVGRFLGFKRVPALVRAFARARCRFTRPGSLVIWGGHPGEWEGEHPVNVAEEVGADGIYFVGWRGHDDLPQGLAACDALVVPSVDDP